MEYLFSNIDGFGFFRKKEEELKREVDSLTKRELENSDDSLKLILKAKHIIKKIEFGNYYQIDKGEIEINVRNKPRFVAYYNRNFNPKPVLRTGRSIEIHLPFSCDGELFKLKPSSFTTILPEASISNDLVFSFNFISGIDKPEELKKRIEGAIELTKKYANWLNKDIESFNNRIETIIDIALRTRREKLKGDDEFLEQLDIPTKNKEEKLGFVKPAKKLSLKIFKEDETKEVDPSLEIETYDEIIKLINDLGINLERSSARLRNLDEESLRDTILMALNSVYQGMASGESFNKKGKTDIIIKYKEKNLFIAECKIWRGDKYFKEGINQLLGYLTWRDTKTSYIIFSRNQKVTEVIDNSIKLIKSHPNFIIEDKRISESSVRYRFKQTPDDSKECYLTLHIFDLK